MKFNGTFKDAQVSSKDKIIVSFEVDRRYLKNIDDIKEGLMTIEVEKYRSPMSDEARKYLWKIADMIAKNETIRSDKESIYLWLISKYGLFSDVTIKNEAVEDFKSKMKQQNVKEFVVLDEDENYTELRCIYSIRNKFYNSKEIYDLIQGAKEEASALGIEVLTPRELNDMLMNWSDTNEGN